METYHFHFTETPRDRMDAYDAVRTAGTQMRAWARFLTAVYGLLFLVGVGVAIADPSQVRWWQFAIWLAIGSWISWNFIVGPAFIRRRILQSPVEEIWVDLSDDGISARAGDAETLQRYWVQVTGVLAAPRGFAIGFRDGTISWLPQRAFGSPELRDQVEAFVKSKLPESAAVG